MTAAAMLMFLPSACAFAQEEPSAAMNAASAYMDAVFPRQCHDRRDLKASGSRLDDKQFSFPYRDDRLLEEEADFTFHLFQMHCFLGAYNSGSVFLKQEDDGGFSVIAFAVPYFVFDYADPGKGSRIKTPPHIVGFRVNAILENAEFNPETRSIAARSSWRGMGDAWDAGTWTEIMGNFVMTRFEVDPTYDDEGGAPPQRPLTYVLVGQK